MFVSEQTIALFKLCISRKGYILNSTEGKDIGLVWYVYAHVNLYHLYESCMPNTCGIIYVIKNFS